MDMHKLILFTALNTLLFVFALFTFVFGDPVYSHDSIVYTQEQHSGVQQRCPRRDPKFPVS